MKNRFKTVLFLCLVVILGASAVTNAQITAGEDQMITDENLTYDKLALPAGAVGTGSLPYNSPEPLHFRGNPASGKSYDTNVRRVSTINELPDTTNIVLEELNLISVDRIRVDFSNGSTRSCRVFVTKGQGSSGGTMTFNGNFSSGGTFTSTLKVIPKFTFSCVRIVQNRLVYEEKPMVTVLDLGSPFVQIALKQQARESRSKILNGTATQSDLIRARLCNTIETKTVKTQQNRLSTKFEPITLDNISNVIPIGGACGITFTGNGGWGPGGIGPGVGDADAVARHQTNITNQQPINNPNPNPRP